jgi:hypothetical protein
MRQISIVVLLACACLASPGDAGAQAAGWSSASAPVQRLPAGAATSLQARCRLAIPGKVVSCFGPMRTGEAESRMNSPLAPPMGVVLRYTHLRLTQLVVASRKAGAAPHAIYYLFGQTSGPGRWVIVEELTSGVVVSGHGVAHRGAAGVWSLSAILPPTNMLVHITTNYPRRTLIAIATRLIERAPDLMTVSIPGLEGFGGGTDFTFWRAFGRTKISRKQAVNIVHASQSGRFKVRTVIKARVLGVGENLNIVSWIVSLVPPPHQFSYEYVFINAATGENYASIQVG